MEEQNKTPNEEVKASSGGTKMVGKVILGIVFIALGLLVLLKWAWWKDLWIIVKGGVGPFLILAGVITIAIAKD
ncbi:MAG: hypothetical protein Q8O30_09095 [Candidatus Omnitrophota bacterium]|nr:hypothetical protein [Candidatus Omnitrophota bacterium]